MKLVMNIGIGNNNNETIFKPRKLNTQTEYYTDDETQSEDDDNEKEVNNKVVNKKIIKKVNKIK